MYCIFNTFWPCILHKSITNADVKVAHAWLGFEQNQVQSNLSLRTPL